jgi:hypothetical protein
VLGAVFVLVTAVTVAALAPGSLRTRGESGHPTTGPVPELWRDDGVKGGGVLRCP